MKSSGTVFIASRIFSSRIRKRGQSSPILGAVLGIALGMLPLIVVLHISGGMINGIISRYIELSSYHIQLKSYRNFSSEEWESKRAKMADEPGVSHAFVERTGFGMVYNSEGKTGVQIRAIPAEMYKLDSGFSRFLNIDSGTFDLSDSRSVVLGRQAAESLSVQVGDELRILTGKLSENGNYVPRLTRMKVTGIISSGYQELDKLWVFISLETGFRILHDTGSLTFIGIKTEDPFAADFGSQLMRISQEMRPELYALSWIQLNDYLRKNYRTTQSILLFIMILVVLVAALNISSSLVMLILENAREIAILKCMGASPSVIQLLYILIGGLAGTVGAISGACIGLVISLNINGIINGINQVGSWLVSGGKGGESFSLLNPGFYLEEIPVTADWPMIIFFILFTIFLSFLSSWLPARKAGGQRPLDIIRKV